MLDEQESSGLESSDISSVLSPPSSSLSLEPEEGMAEDDLDLRGPVFGFPQSCPISFLSSLALGLLCLWLQEVGLLSNPTLLLVFLSTSSWAGGSTCRVFGRCGGVGAVVEVAAWEGESLASVAAGVGGRGSTLSGG